MVATLLAQIGLPVLIGFIKAALEKIDAPVTKAAGEALGKVGEALQVGSISDEQIAEANRHIEKVTELQSQEFQAALCEINKTIRAEVESQDKYVRRMRPTFGYLMALTWAAQMFGIAYIIIFDTAKAGAVMASMGSLSAIWGIGLSVLGVYVYKRSEDKRHGHAGKEKIFWLP